MEDHDEDGWFFGYSPEETIDESGKTRTIDTKNVKGRFRDHPFIDVPASKASGRSVYRTGIILETRVLKTVGGGMQSNDVSVHQIKFTDWSVEAMARDAINRFRDAWDAYQLFRTAPITPEETESVGTKPRLPEMKPEAPKKEPAKKRASPPTPVSSDQPKRKRGRPPKIKPQEAPKNVVELTHSKSAEIKSA